jgi:hypothetical protein
MTVALALILLHSPVFAAAGPTDARLVAARNRLRVLEVRRVPSMPFRASADAAYWRIVRFGRPALRDLATLIADTTPTGIAVPTYGGDYRVGDVAVVAMLEIVHDVPIVEMVQSRDPTPSGGFDAYWRVIRKGPAERLRLRAAVMGWLDEHQSSLVWFAESGHPAGGWYGIAAEWGWRIPSMIDSSARLNRSGASAITAWLTPVMTVAS